jgi:hypothetical protein
MTFRHVPFTCKSYYHKICFSYYEGTNGKNNKNFGLTIYNATSLMQERNLSLTWDPNFISLTKSMDF